MANGNKKTYNQAWSEMTDAEKKKRGYNIKGGKQKFIDQAKDYNRTQERKTKIMFYSSNNDSNAPCLFTLVLAFSSAIWYTGSRLSIFQNP